jgi:hypothetical protein
MVRSFGVQNVVRMGQAKGQEFWSWVVEIREKLGTTVCGEGKEETPDTSQW